MIRADDDCGEPCRLPGGQLTPPAIKLIRPDVRSAGNLRDDRTKRKRRRNQRALLIRTPAPTPLRAKKHRDLTHDTVSNTGANTSTCTSANAPRRPNPARRPSTEAYGRCTAAVKSTASKLA